MCRPLHFDVKYQINPWMKVGTVDKSKAIKQWLNLVQKYEENGIEVQIIDQDQNQPDMVFCADQGLPMSNKEIVLSRFRHQERQGETKIFNTWFSKNNLSLKQVPEGVFFEGIGDCLNYDSLPCFMGNGFRNCQKSIDTIKNIIQKEVVPLSLVNKKFYHLDTCFFILDRKTAFLNPQAFSTESVDKLKKIFTRLYLFDEEEINNFAANSVVHEDKVFLQKGNSKLKRYLKFLDYIPIEVDISEFMKAGGGIHCLTLVLDWA